MSKVYVSNNNKEDITVIFLHPNTLESLQGFRGDCFKITGNNRFSLAIAITDEDCPEGTVKMNSGLRKNVGVELGEEVQLELCSPEYAQKVHILPLEDTLQGVTGNLFERFLKSYFQDAYRPVTQGDLFIARDGETAVEFKVMLTEPQQPCIVSPQTLIFCEGEAVKREDA